MKNKNKTNNNYYLLKHIYFSLSGPRSLMEAQTSADSICFICFLFLLLSY